MHMLHIVDRFETEQICPNGLLSKFYAVTLIPGFRKPTVPFSK